MSVLSAQVVHTHILVFRSVRREQHRHQSNTRFFFLFIAWLITTALKFDERYVVKALYEHEDIIEEDN